MPGKETAPGVEKVYKLSSNETPLGASPKALAAFQAAAASLERYPDGQAHELARAIAEVYGLNAANILCGNGSDELLGLLAHVYLGPGDEAIITEHGFLVYKIQIMAAGATPVTVKEVDCRVDVDAILAAVTEKTKMVFLANPANPTGTFVPVADVRRLHAGLPKSVVLVLDAAYAEYVRRNDYEAGIELVSSNDNVVMTRTFSKIYGLAALRTLVLRPLAIIDALNRCAGPSTSTPRPLQPARRPCGIAPSPPRRSTQRALARPADRRPDGARSAGHALGRQFRADPFPGYRRQAGGRGGRVPVAPRLHSAGGAGLRVPQCAAPVDRHARGQ